MPQYHRDHSLHIEKTNMHYQGIACTRSYHEGLTSAEGQKLECFIWTSKNILICSYENLVNPSCSKVMPVFYLTKATIFMQILWSLCIDYNQFTYTTISMNLLRSLSKYHDLYANTTISMQILRSLSIYCYLYANTMISMQILRSLSIY